MLTAFSPAEKYGSCRTFLRILQIPKKYLYIVMENYSWNVSNLSLKRNGQSAYNINGKMMLNILVLELKMYFTFERHTLISPIV